MPSYLILLATQLMYQCYGNQTSVMLVEQGGAVVRTDTCS